MYNHPELERRLAQAKIEEARSRTQRAQALRAASLDQGAPAVNEGTHNDRWAAPMPATASWWRTRRSSLRANAPWTRIG